MEKVTKIQVKVLMPNNKNVLMKKLDKAIEKIFDSPQFRDVELVSISETR